MKTLEKLHFPILKRRSADTSLYEKVKMCVLSHKGLTLIQVRAGPNRHNRVRQLSLTNAIIAGNRAAGPVIRLRTGYYCRQPCIRIDPVMSLIM